MLLHDCCIKYTERVVLIVQSDSSDSSRNLRHQPKYTFYIRCVPTDNSKLCLPLAIKRKYLDGNFIGIQALGQKCIYFLHENQFALHIRENSKPFSVDFCTQNSVLYTTHTSQSKLYPFAYESQIILHLSFSLYGSFSHTCYDSGTSPISGIDLIKENIDGIQYLQSHFLGKFV